MSYYSVDCEMDGPVCGIHSMVCFGAVKITDTLNEAFYGTTAPISTVYVPEALAISGFTRKEHEKFQDPAKTMAEFEEWVRHTNTGGRPIFVSDNPLDFAFIHYYLHRYTGKNVFGWSGRRIGDLWCGMQKDVYSKWKHLRKTKHDHNPLNDARGNAEAMLAMRDMGLKVNFK